MPPELGLHCLYNISKQVSGLKGLNYNRSEIMYQSKVTSRH